MCARPARSIPSRTSTTGEPAISSATIAHPDDARRRRARAVVSIGANTSAAIGAATAALTRTHSDGLSRSRYVAAPTRDTARCLLHYPRWVTETVDVLIIAPDVPAYAHPGDAGADLVVGRGGAARARASARSSAPACASPCPTATSPSSSRAAAWRPSTASRSSTSPGTVDAGYRGEIKVTLLNTDADEAYDIARRRPHRAAHRDARARARDSSRSRRCPTASAATAASARPATRRRSGAATAASLAGLPRPRPDGAA